MLSALFIPFQHEYSIGIAISVEPQKSCSPTPVQVDVLFCGS